MEKYIPIPQWINRNGKTIGIKDLWMVSTCESDYWIKRIKKVNGYYEVHNCLKIRQAKCVSLDEAIQHIREVSAANMIFYDAIRERNKNGKEVNY